MTHDDNSFDEDRIGPLETRLGDSLEEIDQALAGIRYVDDDAELRLSVAFHRFREALGDVAGELDEIRRQLDMRDGKGATSSM